MSNEAICPITFSHLPEAQRFRISLVLVMPSVFLLIKVCTRRIEDADPLILRARAAATVGVGAVEAGDSARAGDTVRGEAVRATVETRTTVGVVPGVAEERRL